MRQTRASAIGECRHLRLVVGTKNWAA